MGVKFDRILEGFDGPFEKVTEWNVKPPVTAVAAGNTTTWDRRVNDSFTAINTLLKAGGRAWATPTHFSTAPEAGGIALRSPRIGLWDQYGGSITSGWTRWILEQFEFPFTRVFAQELDAGNLKAKYDVLIFVDGAIPAATSGRDARGGGPELTAGDVPAEYRTQLGRMTAEATIPQLRAFAEAGGTIIAIGSSAENIAAHFRLPIEDHLVEDGKPLPRAKYFVPGSVLTAHVDTRHPIAAGMEERTDFFFDNSPVFRLTPQAGDTIRVIASFDTESPLHSGWAWGQKYLKGGVIAAEARVGKGQVLLFGPEILQRAQPHGTFKLLFNSIFSSVAR